MKKRIVFVNLHTNWMMLKVTDVILLKNSVALKHKYLLDYLLHNIDKYEVCTYLNSNCFSLYQRGSDKLQRILRPIGIKENEWIMHQNGIKKGQIVVIKNANELKKDDLIVLYNVKTASYIGMGDVKAFKALSMLHFYGREEEDELIKNANINCFFNEVNLKTNCELYRKYYHIDKPWIIHPFVFAERFQNRKPFNERKNMAFATGTITYKVHKEFLDTYGDSCDQPSRKQIKDNPEFFKDTVYCTSSDYLEDNAGKPIKDNDFVLIKLYKKIYNRLFTGKQKKYFSFDMVEAFNSYKMCIVGEEILGIPGIGFVEGMACGCAYIGIDSPAYRDWGLVPGIHYITYDGTKEDLKRVIEYYQMDEHQEELERIARTGYDYVRTHFNGDAVAETLLHDLEEQQRIWLAQKG